MERKYGYGECVIRFHAFHIFQFSYFLSLNFANYDISLVTKIPLKPHNLLKIMS